MTMQNGIDDIQLNTESSLKAWFHSELCRATDTNNIEVCEETIWYLTNLLHNYSRSDRFFDYSPDCGTLTPLAEYYRHALEADSEHERRQYLQRLGDVAIFISGFFAAALCRRAVGINYYIAMGENAYGFLADSTGDSARERELGKIFADLSNRFSGFVTVISTIGPNSGNLQGDLLQMIDRWEKTADPAIASQLKRCGVVLPDTPTLCH